MSMSSCFISVSFRKGEKLPFFCLNPKKNLIFHCFTCQASPAQNNIPTIFQNLLQSWNSDRVQQFRRSRNSNNADGGNFRLSLV